MWVPTAPMPPDRAINQKPLIKIVMIDNQTHGKKRLKVLDQSVNCIAGSKKCAAGRIAI